MFLHLWNQQGNTRLCLGCTEAQQGGNVDDVVGAPQIEGCLSAAAQDDVPPPQYLTQPCGQVLDSQMHTKTFVMV